jgi:hypothetical protein
MRAGGPVGPGAFLLKSKKILDASLADYGACRKCGDVRIFPRNLKGVELLWTCHDDGFSNF